MSPREAIFPDAAILLNQGLMDALHKDGFPLAKGLPEPIVAAFTQFASYARCMSPALARQHFKTLTGHPVLENSSGMVNY